MTTIKTCPICGTSFKVYKSQKRCYCSRECLSVGYKERLQGKNNPNFKHGLPVCPICKADMSRNSKGKYCTKCSSSALGGKNNPFYGKKHKLKTKVLLSSVWKDTHNNDHWIGRSHLQASKEKMRDAQIKIWASMSKEEKEKRLSDLKRGFETQIGYNKTLPEDRVEKMIIEAGISYKYNEFLKDKFFVDFHLPVHNTIIEVFGDYWHANPLVFPNPSSNQVRQMKKDKSRLAYLRACGYQVIVFWESDILRSPTKIKQAILELKERDERQENCEVGSS